MTTRRTPTSEQLLVAWFEDGPTTMPDRVVDVVADRIGRTRQRRSWRLPRRLFVNTYTKLAAAAAAVVLVAVVGYSIMPRNDVGPVNPTVAPSATPAPTPTAAATAAPSPIATFAFPTTGILNPGSHATSRFSPGFTFTVSEVWINDGDTAGGSGEVEFYSLFPDNAVNRSEWARTGSAAQGILVADVASPYWYCNAWEDHSGATAAERVAKVTANKALETTGVIDVEIGGLTGKQFDLRVNPAWTETCPGDPPGTDLSVFRSRAILLDVPGGGVIDIFVGTTQAADFDGYLAVAMPVVESFQFDLGQ